MAKSDYQMLINGISVDGTETYDVFNPATGESFAEAPNCTPDELDSAVQAARDAFPSWKKTSMEDRKNILLAMAGRIAENAQDIARLLTEEQGKPFSDSMIEVMGTSYWFSQTAQLTLPTHIDEDDQRRTETRFDPIGVVAAVVPWNFPVLMAAFKVGPALMAGNTVVLKPAPTTPLATLKMAEIIADLLPPGVLNVISGGDRLGPWLTVHKGVDKITFTGSTQVGKKVMAGAADTLKRVTLELGGNDAAIILPDVDVNEVAEKLFWTAFQNAGQICIAAKRMYIHKDIYKPLSEAIVEYAKTVKVGAGNEQGTQIGPVQNQRQYERVLGLIEDAKSQGLEFLHGGTEIDSPGYFIPVTLIDNPPEDARIVSEEQFGPVLPLLKFDDVDEAVARANASEFGLGATVWTKDDDLAQDIANRLEAGTIWLNESHHLSPVAIFGGAKQSGLGVEGGLEGLLEFTQAKTIFTAKDQPAA